MSIERQPDRFSPEDVVRIAKETTLRDGQHIPMVIAQGSAGGVITYFPELPESHEDKARLMFATGVAFARSQQVGVLQDVFFISEAWTAVLGKDEEVQVRPSQDPNRIEVLIIFHHKVEGEQTEMTMFEMVRDREDQLVELKLFEHPRFDKGGHAESPLVDAFLDGFRKGVVGKHN